MANLVSVKTLDMVNGEITKVEYGGAEYERVEGKAKVGDMVLVKEAWGDQNVGEFFVVTYTKPGIIDQIVGMDGNTCEASSYKHRLKIFRKVAASTNPSVEERVAKAEGEIESLKSDVAALKGEAVYERIAASVEAEPKPERLKVGDYAKVVNADQHTMDGFSVGDIVEIVESEYGEHDVDFYVMSLAGDNSGYIRKTPEYIVRATDEEVAEAKDAAARAKFKRGDKVRLKSGGEKFPLSGFSDGGVYTVMYNDFNHSHGKRIRIADGTEGFGYATPDQLEILSEEEAAELKKWAEIGREVGEYKTGDVVSYDDDTWFGNSGIGEIFGFCGKEPQVRAVDGRGAKSMYYLKPGKLRLITPVEARFDH